MQEGVNISVEIQEVADVILKWEFLWKYRVREGLWEKFQLEIE